MKRIAIVGGGISGLAAAFALEERRRAGEALEFVVYESSPRFGGVLFTEQVEGCLIEAGPDSFLTEKPWAADLCRRLGIEDQLIGSNDADRKTYILVKGKLVPMPDGLMFMVPTQLSPAILSSLFSPATKLRVAREWWYPARLSNGDESVAALVERHYGAEMVDRLADPLLAGVYGGEAAQLSVRAVLPRFVDMERKHGSLSRAMLAARKQMAAKNVQSAPRPLFTSLKNGMRQLVDTIEPMLMPRSIQTSNPIVGLTRSAHHWIATPLQGSPGEFDAVILAVPASAASTILANVAPDLAGELGQIRYSSSITVNLGYSRADLQKLPPGFGFLVPRSEYRRMLACTFVHVRFPHRAPEDKGILRCFIGGARDESVLELPDHELIDMVRRNLAEILSLTAEPRFARVYRWRRAMAQYTSGHLARVQHIRDLQSSTVGLYLA